MAENDPSNEAERSSEPEDSAPLMRPATTSRGRASGPQAISTTDRATPDDQSTISHDAFVVEPKGQGVDQLRQGIPPGSIPGYQLLEVLGTGGMGVVTRALQVGLNRIVAIKTIRRDRWGGHNSMTRFLAEAEAVASIRHPDVVQVYQFGEVDGVPFLAMEYLPGGTLARRLEVEHRLAPAEAAGLVARLASAVQAAHDCEIVHRDLKPLNILFDADGEPKITDFGLAKLAKGQDLTHSGEFLGTPAYMSPEQARGETRFVGPTTDVYALGVILYECLVGDLPFRAEHAQGLLRMISEEDPELPSRLVPGLPRDLELITLKCLEKDPADRYPTARALAEDLGDFIAGRPVSVRSPGKIERALKWARRRPTLAAAYVLTFAVLGLAAFGASVAVLWRQALEARDLEKEARREAETAREKLARVEYGRSMQIALQEFNDSRVRATRSLLDAARPDLRGWEWRYLNRLALGELVIFKGHVGLVRSAAYSPDGSRLATGGSDKTARVWDARSGAEQLILKGHAAGLVMVVWSPDGSRIATASDDKTARVWDARTGAEQLTLTGHANEVYWVEWSPDGSRIVTAGLDFKARIWDARSGAEQLILKGADGEKLVSANFSPDGSRLAGIIFDRKVRVWDVTTGAEQLILDGQPDWVWSAAWSPDGSRIATGSKDDTTRLWDAGNGAILWTLRGRISGGGVRTTFGRLNGKIDAIAIPMKSDPAFSPDGSRIVTVDSESTTRIWDTRTGAELIAMKGRPTENRDVATFSPDGSQIAVRSSADIGVVRVRNARTGAEVMALKGIDRLWSLRWSPGGSRIVSTSQDGTARLWDARGDMESPILKGHTLDVTSVSWSPDGSRIVTSSLDKTGRIWDAMTGAELLILKGTLGFLNSVAWSPDGSRVATAGHDRSVRVFDATTGTERLSLKGHSMAVDSVKFSPDSSRIATAGHDKTARIWDARTGAEILALQGHTSVVRSAVFSPDGSRIATAGDDPKVQIWDARTGSKQLEFEGHLSYVEPVAWSPDGSRIAIAGGGNTVRIFDTTTGAELLTMNGHFAGLKSVAWSPDGSRIATASYDETARIWDTTTGAELLALKGHIGTVTSAAWSPDGSRIATGAADGTVRIWDAKTRAESYAARPVPIGQRRPR